MAKKKLKLRVYHCERCDEKLNQKTMVWLEYDRRTATYTDAYVPEDYSQGGFTFGKACAKKELAKDKFEKENCSTYWHNYSLHVIVDIVCSESEPNTDENWEGPFKTFKEAKQDAIDKAQWEYNTAKQMLRETRKLKKS